MVADAHLNLIYLGYLLNKSLSTRPYYDEMISLIPYGGSRPSIPEYPQIAQYIKDALDSVYYRTKDPKEALDDAATENLRLYLDGSRLCIVDYGFDYKFLEAN